MGLKDILPHRITQFRIIEIIGALTLGLFSIILGIAEIGALFNLPSLFSGLGGFFVDSLGILSFAIPGYLLYAALLLADSCYRPDRIFILNCVLFPFLTLAIGFVFIRDFDIWSERFIFLYWMGKGGFNFFIILLTVIEGLVIGAFTSVLFPAQTQVWESRGSYYETSAAQEPLYKEKPEPEFRRRHSPVRRSKIASILLSPPILKKRYRSITVIEEEDIYEDDSFEDTAGFDIENLALPDIKPLATPTAITQLELVSHKPVYQTEADDNVQYSKNGIVYDQTRGGEARLGTHVRYADFRTSSSRLSWSAYHIPVDGILNQYPESRYWIIDQKTKDTAVILKETLEEFGIQAEVTGIQKGPVITMFEVLPGPGVKLSEIVNLQDTIALRLAAVSMRIVAPIPGKHAVGIEVPNAKRGIVSFAEIMYEELQQKNKKSGIPVILGKDTTGETQIGNLVQMPHVLIAGAAGSGKSVCIHAMILSILYRQSPAQCRLVLIDPQISELKLYNNIPHLLTPIIIDPKQAFQALQYCIFEMERRYARLNSMRVRDIQSYNKRMEEQGMATEPYIVVIINEFADLMAASRKYFEPMLVQLATRSQAAGIHLILGTRHPSIDIITSLIKTHIPSHIAFMVANKTDSRMILDIAGAEKLLGKGDMLYAETADPFPIRIQGAFVSEEEVERVVEYVKTLGDPEYLEDPILMDDEDAARSVL